MASDFGPLLSRLEHIRNDCQGKANDHADDRLDDFTKTKKRVNRDIKEIRQHLKRRDALFEVDPRDEKGIALAAALRTRIRKVFADAESLQSMYLQEKAKWAKKKDKPDGVDQLLENREQVVRLTFLHVQELEMLEQRRHAEADAEAAARDQLFEMREIPHDRGSAQSYGVVDLPDLEAFPDIRVPDMDVEEGFATQESNERRIDHMLDQVLDGVVDLKQLAQAIGSKVDEGDVILAELDADVEDANANLDTLNAQLLETLNKIRSPGKFCCDVMLVLLFLGLIGLVIKIVNDRS